MKERAACMKRVEIADTAQSHNIVEHYLIIYHTALVCLATTKAKKDLRQFVEAMNLLANNICSNKCRLRCMYTL